MELVGYEDAEAGSLLALDNGWFTTGLVNWLNIEFRRRKKLKQIRIIIAGSRNFNDYILLNDEVNNIISRIKDKDNKFENYKIEIISGAARGADILGEKYANSSKFDVIKFIPDWKKLGKKAGYIRNSEMAKYAVEDGNYGVLIAFWDGKSKGTKHMIDLAKANGLEVHIVRFDNAEITE